ncbi:MFS transporter [Streptomyces sp. NPDC023723]|uniref:MFS transporter n=1 Tax=Streptomyces sp. NPDC023723 TaxID=3154323 RepID=UPI0034105CCF
MWRSPIYVTTWAPPWPRPNGPSNGYKLVLAALLLAGGSLGHRFGLRRSLCAGLVLFTLASAACSLAPSPAVLIAARAVQGLGASALLRATLALIPHVFPDKARREKAAVVWVATSAIAVAAGPLVGGARVDSFGWRSIFLINALACTLSWIMVMLCLKPNEQGTARVGLPGQLLGMSALGLITGALIAGGALGWSAPLTLGLFAAGVAAGLLFTVVERRVHSPLLPLSFFSYRMRTSALLSLGFTGFLSYGALFVMSLYFQQARGWTPGATGRALLPMTVGTVLAPFFLYRPLSKRFGHPVMMVTGFTTMLLGALTLYGTDASTPHSRIAIGIFLIDCGSTFTPSAAASIVVSSTPPEQSGLASGVQNTLRQSGGLISVAVFGSILNTSDFTGRMGAALSVTTAAALLGISTGIAAVRGERASRQGIPGAGGNSLTTASATTNTTSPQRRS